jgi:alkylation response protein AidB-like acyl-CoA dehydrogenase
MRTYWWNTDQNLTLLQDALKSHAQRFANERMRPAAEALNRLPGPEQILAAGSPLWEVIKAAYQQRWHSALVPLEAGGLGLRGIDLAVLFEELGWASADMAVSLMLTGLPFSFVAAARNTDLIEEFVRPFAADREAKLIGCWAISEPEHGSDQFLLGTEEFSDLSLSGQLRAYPDGEEYVTNGAKSAWVANAAIATHMVASLTLFSERNVAGKAIAFIPLDLPGVTREQPMDMLGQRALAQAAVHFKNVRLPRRYLLVERSHYEDELAKTLVFVHAAMGAIFTGVARAAFDLAVSHAQTREQGGKPLVMHQLVQKRLFEMYTRIEAARALSRAAMLYDEKTGPILERAVAAKVFCTQAAFDVADSAMTLFGAQGLAKDHPAAKLFRDARASLMECGSNDVLALLAANRLTTLPNDGML